MQFSSKDQQLGGDSFTQFVENAPTTHPLREDMAININRVRKARLFVSVIVIALCLFSISILFLREINASNGYEQLLIQYFPVLVIPATCIYLIILALRIHKLEHKVTEASFYDPLTHTLKNMHLIKKARKAYQTTNLAESPISILCIGIDRVSAIENEYGEDAARAVLREFGGTLIGATREHDFVGKYQENVFVAVVMNTGQAHSHQVVQRFQELAHADVLLAGDREVRYSVCVGYSSSDQEGDTPTFDSLLEQAKSALVAAKEEGPGTINSYAA